MSAVFSAWLSPHQRLAGLVALGMCAACGMSNATAGVETARSGGVVWLRGGATSSGAQSGLVQIGKSAARSPLHQRQDANPAVETASPADATRGASDLTAMQPADAPAEPFIGMPGAFQAFGRRATLGLADRPRPLSDMAPVLPVVAQAAEAHRLDPALLLAVIHAESGFNPLALSPKGAVGLMQLMPTTASRYGTGDLRDPLRNVQAGAAHLRYLLGRYGDLSLALAAYNAGEGAVERYGMRIPPYAETQDYVPRVLSLYRRYQQRGEGSQPREPSAHKILTTWPAASRPSAGEARPTAGNLRSYTANLN